MTGGERITVRGLVQGVGFRPFVYRIAQETGITGAVRNTGAGVEIDVYGEHSQLDAFRQRLSAEPPPLARIDLLDSAPLEDRAPPAFRIESSAGGALHAAATPDAGLCPACLAELSDPGDRRHGYVFLNCTHCGPRFSILTALPYDRANTTMAAFLMCAACRTEYEDVADRRFHAQPTACPACGPTLWAERADDPAPLAGDPVAMAADSLAAGGVVALKGVGGFHLSCDAANAAAVARLRERKRRPAKPFALMLPDLDTARRHCHVSDAEAEALSSPTAPIVLLDRRADCVLPETLAPGLNRLGVMLPYSPLHARLMQAVDRPLVMTSGNPGGDPQVTENAAAREWLADFADLFLVHDRGIANRVDDSLVQVTGGTARPLRRARGLAPRPLPLPEGFGGHPQVIALGGDIKNAFALAKAGVAVLSQHIGDLESLATQADLHHALDLFRRLYELSPALIVADAHPGYHSHILAHDLATAEGIPCLTVDHHHAHAAAGMAEHGVPADAPPVLALVQDGIGLGPGGALWGAELLHCDYRRAERLATLRPAPLPGGDAAAREPWRNLLARLDAVEDAPAVLLRRLPAQPAEMLCRAMRAGINAPDASSAGRLFDAVAAAAGLCVERQDYEGEAAIRLQAAAERWEGEPLPYTLALRYEAGQMTVDPAPLWPQVAGDLDRDRSAGEIAARFHAGWADAWANATRRAADATGCACVFLSGGVFQNRLLAAMLGERLRAAGLQVHEHAEVPANDGGLALGQIAIALAHHAQQEGA
jgi:hydrogenase maturation protein HypF